MADDITTGTSEQAAGAGGQPSAPAPITLTETSSFIPPGGKDPVSWKDFQSGYVSKADLTRMRQEDTARQSAERQTWQQQERQRLETELRQQVQQQTQTQQGGQQVGQFLSTLRAQPYLSGEQAAGLVEQTIIPLAHALSESRKEYAQALGLLTQRVERMQQSVGGFTSEYQQTKLSSLMQSTKTKLALPDSPVVDEMLQDVYHAYTGWESDPDAFERTVGERWKGIVEAIRAADRKQADQARQRPFAPGQPGGTAKPSRPLVRGNESPEELADRLFTGLQPVNT